MVTPAAAAGGGAQRLPAYAELHCRSNFTFLTGASHPEELVTRAHGLGYTALAITDECSLAGVVRAHGQAKRLGLHLIVGAEMRLALGGVGGGLASAAGGGRAGSAAGGGACGPRLVLLAQSRRGYGNLAQWVTVARRRAGKGSYTALASDVEGRVPHAPYLAGLPDCFALMVVDPALPFE
ncbi:MAG TPA: PHP domain-containing protein, partial [Burkholderiaceae bacterium]|nr:PHP domain-containing protein [Burkholderiaceae bacterium]